MKWPMNTVLKNLLFSLFFPVGNSLWASITRHKMETACMSAAEQMTNLCLFRKKVAVIH